MGKADLHARVDHDMTNHAPDPGMIPRFEEIRARSRDLAHLMIDLCPEGRDLARALTYVEEGQMLAVASIARNRGAVLDDIAANGPLAGLPGVVHRAMLADGWTDDMIGAAMDAAAVRRQS